jgi:hypothetical protein
MWISVVPSDVRWQPTTDAANQAAQHVRGLFARPGSYDEVRVRFHGRIAVIDPGENLEQISCSACDRDISLDWFRGFTSAHEWAFDDLEVVVPCCGRSVALDSLSFDWPARFARFEIQVLNPTRAQYELTDRELVELGQILGHPLRQVLGR